MLSFFAGSSGRFLSCVAWHIINGIDNVIPLEDTNACHVIKPWENDESYLLPYGEMEILSTPSIYDDIVWVDSGIVPTHIFPNFESLRNNLALRDTKVFLIALAEEDIAEIAHNAGVKNIKQAKSLGKEDEVPSPEFLYSSMKNLYRQGNPNLALGFYNFFNPDIPDDLLDKIIVIDYKSIYEPTLEGSYVALDILKHHIGKPVPPAIMESFNVYVGNRNANLEGIYTSLNAERP